MILDKENIFSTAQAVTASAASTDIIDQGAAGNAIGSGLFLVIASKAAALAAGAATVNVKLETSIDAAFTSPILLMETGPIAKAAITANTVLFRGRIPVGARRFIRVNYEVLTGPLTAGTFDAYLTMNVQVGF